SSTRTRTRRRSRRPASRSPARPRVLHDRPAPAEADGLVERARRLCVAENDGLAHPLLPQPLQRKRADGGPEPAPAELLPRSDGLEEADAVLVVGPDEHVRGEALVRRLDDAVERAAVRPRGHDVRIARLADARRGPDVAMDRHALGEVVRLDRAEAESVRQWSRLGRLGHVANVEVERALRLGEPVPRAHRARSLVVIEGAGHPCRGIGEDLVQKIETIRKHVVLEDPAVALQPRPCDHAAVLAPQAERPLRLTPLVLAETPGHVADVPRRARPEQASLLESEL